jgi:hypothetical protein
VTLRLAGNNSRAAPRAANSAFQLFSFSAFQLFSISAFFLTSVLPGAPSLGEGGSTFVIRHCFPNPPYLTRSRGAPDESEVTTFNRERI